VYDQLAVVQNHHAWIVGPKGTRRKMPASSNLRRWMRRRFDPAEATGLALTVALLLIFLMALAFGQVAEMVTSRTGLYREDAAVADWGARHATPLSTHVLSALTWLGSTTVIIGLAVAAGLYEWYRRRRWRVLTFMVTVTLGQNLIANGVKLLVERQRPPVPHLTGSSGWSFPSGHSAAAAATYAALALLLGRGRRWQGKAWLGVAAAIVTVAVGSSRVLLGVHWVTDVIAGIALGLGWFTVCAIAFGGSMLVFGYTAAVAETKAAYEDWRRDGPAV
jgi:membrane-associated phospholipid phosphatase